jgi:hypothetical protein
LALRLADPVFATSASDARLAGAERFAGWARACNRPEAIVLDPADFSARYLAI